MIKTKPSIEALIKQKICVLDGATGTALQDLNLTAQDFGGEDYDGCNEYLVLTRPDAIKGVHEKYLKAGADIIETNTFGATRMVLDEYNLGDKVHEINTRAVELAKEMAERYSTPEKPRYVAGAMGPTTKSLSVTGGITFDELAAQFEEQAISLIKAGVDYLLFETALDTLNLKAAYIGALAAFDTCQTQVPIAISGTIETMGTMLAGQGVEALYTSIEHMNPLYIGLNCATGPEFMRDHIRTLAEISRFPVAVVPNAGIPDADGTYPETPKQMAATLGAYADAGWLNIVGGCCGTTEVHIRELVATCQSKPPRRPIQTRVSRISGIEPLILDRENRPYIIGERTNVIGSRAFKTLIENDQFEQAAEIARKQVQAGAHIIDVCLSNPDRDEATDMIRFLEQVNKRVKVPLMIDSQVPEVVEAAFKRCQGKCILNSVNLEEGEKSFEELLPIVKKYGAAVVVGCIEGEMAVTAQDKLRIAENSYRLLTEKYGIPEQDIIFDPLVFPCGTGDEHYIGSGFQTIEGVRLISEKFPNTQSTLGISNVSFGLPAAGREVLNSVFVYHCTKAGLTTAIVNSQGMVRYSTISDKQKALCDALLWYKSDNGQDPVAEFSAFYRDKKVKKEEAVDFSNLTVAQRLEINIVQGTKEHLIENLDDALTKWDALGVINGPLMAAMAVVGRLFNDNELIVAEVLQSAQVMKAAVSYLEGFMEKTQTASRATMLLATVKGDVHDIGKNLVEIIFSNNGFKIIDLGIKCPPETLIEAYHTHKPNLIGLSGLLVKSAQQMVITANDLNAAGISIPILVGGAALTQRFTDSKISPEYKGLCLYAKDAMSGLDIANQLTEPNPVKREQNITRFITEQKNRVTESTELKPAAQRNVKKITLTYGNSPAKAPHFNPVIVTESIDAIWPFINEQMVYSNHLGLKGRIKTLREKQDPKFLKLESQLLAFKQKIQDENLLTAKAIYQFFKVRKDGDTLIVLNEAEDKVLQRFTFPRQLDGNKRCLTDFVAPDKTDEVCFFVATCGDGVAQKAKALMQEGHYMESHILSAIALECAEAFSEKLHQDIRRLWGIPDPDTITLEDLFKVKYTGVRVSFGYPACPRLEDQKPLWDLLKPDQAIGVELSEEYMMSPEASVSALVFHHPQAQYFTINDAELEAFQSGLLNV